jgi:splicing factor 45
VATLPGDGTTNVTASASISADAVVFAPPELVSMKPPAPTLTPSDNKQSQGWGKKVKPPSMVLDDDVNGFQSRRNEKRGGGKKKTKKVINLISILDS